MSHAPERDCRAALAMTKATLEMPWDLTRTQFLWYRLLWNRHCERSVAISLGQGTPMRERDRRVASLLAMTKRVRVSRADRAGPLQSPPVVPIRYSKRIFEITVPLPSNKGKSGRRNNVRQPHRDNAATHSSHDPESALHAPSAEGTPEITSVPCKPTSTSQGHPKTRTATKPKKPRLTEAEKRERDRKRAAERRQRQKDNGLCISCPATTIEGQTRCPDCAEKHRVSLRPYSEMRRRAQGAKPIQRISDAELLQRIQAEVDARESQVSDPSIEKVRPNTQSLSRAQRTSFGICLDCDFPSEVGHTRCTLCLLRLRLYSRRRRAKAPSVPATASKADTASSRRAARQAPPAETDTMNHGGNHLKQPNPSPHGPCP